MTSTEFDPTRRPDLSRLPGRIGPSGLPDPPGPLVLHGGGAGSDTARYLALELAGGHAARVLIIPHAAHDAPEAGAYLTAWFLDQQVVDVAVFNPEEPGGRAVASIVRSDLIWMTSGQQGRLLDALTDPSIRDALRSRLAAGCVVGGTSAGAAVLGEVAILGDAAPGEDDMPVAPGLNLWPKVVVDSHFLTRSRTDRLRRALRQTTGCLGVGIDEATTLIVAPGLRHLVTDGPADAVVMLPAEASPGR